ncbi:MAG: hypothetical protein IPK82_15515 [Polyangiaceae bacterium]|nr:hypothetical protein [Polyangiaceae bacterium]
MLDGRAVRAAGWIFRGAKMRDREIVAAYQRATGHLVTVILAHQAQAAFKQESTARFAIFIKQNATGADTSALLAAIATQVRHLEASFVWQKTVDAEQQMGDARDVHTCITTCEPWLTAISQNLRKQGNNDVHIAQTKLFSWLTTKPNSTAAALIGARTLVALQQPQKALPWLAERTEALPPEDQSSLLLEQLRIASEVGFCREAVQAAEALLRRERTARTLTITANFFLACRDHERASELAKQLVNCEPEHSGIAAKILSETGQLQAARHAASRAAQSGVEEAAWHAAAAYEVTENCDEAKRIYSDLEKNSSRRLEARAALCRLALWEGDYALAIEWADRILGSARNHTDAIRWRAAASLMLGNMTAAEAGLRELESLHDNSVETWVWRGEFALCSGDYQSALQWFEKAQQGAGSFSPLDIVAGVTRAQLGEWGTSYQPFLDGYVSKLPVATESLRRLGLKLNAESETPLETLQRWRKLVGGNRSRTLTSYSTEHGLLHFNECDNCRSECRRAQDLVQTGGVEAALATFQQVVERFPDKPFPLCYRGELLVWLGQYDAARVDFESALRIRQDTRWAYVGLGAVDLLTGNCSGAIETFERGAEMANGAGPTTFAYRGEAYRLQGNLAGAVTDLTHACRTAPLRVGAWINLALTHAAMDDSEALQKIYHELHKIAPGLLAEAKVECAFHPFELLGPAAQNQLMEHMLKMLRGNRSSTFGTWFNSRGELRAVTWRKWDIAGEMLQWMESAIQRRVENSTRNY